MSRLLPSQISNSSEGLLLLQKNVLYNPKSISLAADQPYWLDIETLATLPFSCVLNQAFFKIHKHRNLTELHALLKNYLLTCRPTVFTPVVPSRNPCNYVKTEPSNYSTGGSGVRRLFYLSDLFTSPNLFFVYTFVCTTFSESLHRDFGLTVVSAHFNY